MSNISDNYTLLINKLDGFIRKYYVNQLVRGSLYSIAIILLFYLFIIFAEYKFYFSPFTRKLMFYSFLATSLSSLWFLVVQPIAKIYSFGDRISHIQASTIIGSHFKNVQDKLLNILQLKEASISLIDASLIQASINQKSLELNPVPFTSAVDLAENKKYLRFALPPLIILFSLLAFSPSILKESTNRIINNNTYYERPMPFSFIINTDSLKAVQFQDFKLEISVEGNELPSEVFLVKNNIKTNIQKLNATNFAYIFTNVQENTTFYLEANGFTSKQYSLDVIAKPLIKEFTININYPKYLNKSQEILKNSGDINVPFGSSVDWVFDAVATDEIFMQFSDTSIGLKKNSKNNFIYNKVLKNNDNYIIKIKNLSSNLSDSSQFSISVIPDEYPQISVEEFIDSTNKDVLFYIGEVSDDYGLVSLNFYYRIEKNGSTRTGDKYSSVSIPFTKGVVSEFSYYWNVKQLNLSPGDRVDYYFQVSDNDGVSGSKSSRSKWMSYKLPSVDEYENETKEELAKIQEGLLQSIDKSKELQQELKDIQQKLFQKKETAWDDKKKLEEFINQQKQLQNEINQLEKKLDNNIKKQSEFKEVSPEIKKKQDQLQKLFNDILDEETKAMIEKLEKMMEDLSKDKMMDQLKEMELSDEQLEKELDRMLELLKKLEFEQKVEETIKKLEELANEQEKLSEKSNDKNADSEKLKEEQEKLKEKFDKLKEDLQSLQEMSDDMNKENFSDLQDKAEEVDDEQEKASDNLNKKNNQKASENQKKGAEKMKEMSKDLAKMKSSMDMQAMEEDMESLRRLLENLIKLSFNQEDLIYQFKNTTINTPKYLSLIQQQFKLVDDTKLVEDSLFALAKRVFEIESFITDELAAIKLNLSKTQNLLEERRVQNAGVTQQYTMTGYNNLALMLSEVMEQMQQQMAEQMEGDQMCQNPGNKPGKKPGKIPGLKQLQQQLNDQMNQMSEMMKEGSSPGGKSGMSQKMAEMAAKQQQIRKALEEINNSENKDGNGSLGNLQEIIDKMDKTETDLVNKQITNELLKRQQEIMTRLLEAENAEKQRDEKEERESNVAKQYINKTPPSLEEYLKNRESSIELYKALPPSLKPYYRSISEKYFKNLTNNQ